MTAPGVYEDQEGTTWEIHENGLAFAIGNPQPFPVVALSSYGPLTPLVPLPTREVLAYRLFARAFGPKCTRDLWVGVYLGMQERYLAEADGLLPLLTRQVHP